MDRRNVSSGAVWEPIIGYSRAVQVGPWIVVAGTAAADDEGPVVSPGDAYGQAVYAFRKIQASLAKAGGRMKDVFGNASVVRRGSGYKVMRSTRAVEA